jgi:Protein of unknown function (DUF2802)
MPVLSAAPAAPATHTVPAAHALPAHALDTLHTVSAQALAFLHSLPSLQAISAYVRSLPIDVNATLLTGRAVFLVFSFILAAVTFRRWRRAAQRDAEQVLERSQLILDRLERIEASLGSTDTRVTGLTALIDEQARASKSQSPTNYGVAIRLARNGVSREDLMAGCGLTQQEAELLIRLHAAGPKRTLAA